MKISDKNCQKTTSQHSFSNPVVKELIKVEENQTKFYLASIGAESASAEMNRFELVSVLSFARSELPNRHNCAHHFIRWSLVLWITTYFAKKLE